MDGEGGAFLFLWAIFPKIPTIFPNVGKNEGFFGGKRDDIPFFFTFQPSFSSSFNFFP